MWNVVDFVATEAPGRPFVDPHWHSFARLKVTQTFSTEVTDATIRVITTSCEDFSAARVGSVRNLVSVRAPLGCLRGNNDFATEQILVYICI